LLDCASILLTCHPDDLRDPEAALKFAVEAQERTDHPRADLFDTLAMACYANGDTARAVELERRALALVPKNAPERSEYEMRLAEYEAAVRQE